jgi:flagellar motor protein MotB
MKGVPPPPKEQGEKVPIWIVSFADMITLLLSFFVMLQTMSHSRDGTLFGVAQDSFRRSIIGFGIPDLILGKPPITNFDYRKLKYPTEETHEPNIPPGRIIDAEDEDIRQSFARMRKQMESSSSNLSERLVQSLQTPIRFDTGSFVLDSRSRQYLQELSADLKQSMAGRKIRIYVVSAARDGAEDKERWLLAASRAGQVEEYLRSSLAPELRGGAWELYCLGGGDVSPARPTSPKASGPASPAGDGPQVTIHIMGKND